jgi:Fe-Mn family superoxide dismutase
MKNRREFIKKSSLLAAGTIGALALKSKGMDFVLNENAGFTLPKLPYDYNALEPHIDTLTMQLHHDKHHQTYVDKLNEAVKANKLESETLESLLTNASKYPAAIRNHGGGHYNHSMFWKMMKPNGGGAPAGELAEAINASFGNFEEFKSKFNDVAKSRFGSGWAWLVKHDGKLIIGSTANQDNPLMDISELKGKPVLGLDVWEHAYYLHYQNRRADYITSWWNVVNWDEAANLFKG